MRIIIRTEYLKENNSSFLLSINIIVIRFLLENHKPLYFAYNNVLLFHTYLCLALTCKRFSLRMNGLSSKNCPISSGTEGRCCGV